jgi:hypothetical protein
MPWEALSVRESKIRFVAACLAGQGDCASALGVDNRRPLQKAFAGVLYQCNHTTEDDAGHASRPKPYRAD